MFGYTCEAPKGGVDEAEQLAAIEPSFKFDDTFQPRAMDFVPEMKTYDKGYAGWSNIPEAFIEDFINFVQVSWNTFLAFQKSGARCNFFEFLKHRWQPLSLGCLNPPCIAPFL